MFGAGLGSLRQGLWLTSCGKKTRQLLTLQASQFPDALAQELTATQAAYVEDPLLGLESTQKGRVLQQALFRPWQALMGRFVYIKQRPASV